MGFHVHVLSLADKKVYVVNKLNPELESQVQSLAELCCEVLERRETDSTARAQPLLEALVAGGYARLSNVNLQTRLEEMTVDRCRDRTLHRRGELTGITGQMQATFNELVRWRTKSPHEPSGTKGANISSNTIA
jgi:hypothetical protein